METKDNLKVIQQLYVDFGARNVEGVFNSLTDDICWIPPASADIPHTKLRNGKNEVLEWIKEMGAEVTYSQVTPYEMYADKDAVIVKGFFAGTANNTGKSFESDFIHFWQLRDGKVYRYQAFWNTNNVAKAMK